MPSVFRIAKTGYTDYPNTARPRCACGKCNGDGMTEAERSAVANGWELDGFRRAVEWLRELSATRRTSSPVQAPAAPDLAAALRAARR